MYDGEFVRYYPNNVPQVKGYYKAGIKSGKWTFYDKAGKVSAEKTFVNGDEVKIKKTGAY